MPFLRNEVEDASDGLKVIDDQRLQTLKVPLKNGDEILSFCRSFVGAKNEWEKLDKCTIFQIKGTVGDPVQLRVRRIGGEFIFRMPLYPTVERLPETSARSSGFPAAFDMALKLSPDDCGAPLVGIDGSCIGMALETPQSRPPVQPAKRLIYWELQRDPIAEKVKVAKGKTDDLRSGQSYKIKLLVLASDDLQPVSGARTSNTDTSTSSEVVGQEIFDNCGVTAGLLRCAITIFASWNCGTDFRPL